MDKLKKSVGCLVLIIMIYSAVITASLLFKGGCVPTEDSGDAYYNIPTQRSYEENYKLYLYMGITLGCYGILKKLNKDD